MSNYYMIITNKLDYLKDVENEFQCAGFPARNKKSVMSMRPGDKIVYYVSKLSRFCAIVEVTGEYYYSKKQIWTDDYDLWEHRIPTTPITFKKSYLDGIYIKDIWDHLEMIKNKYKWGSQVMGSFRKLSEHDFYILFNTLTKGVEN